MYPVRASFLLSDNWFIIATRHGRANRRSLHMPGQLSDRSNPTQSDAIRRNPKQIRSKHPSLLTVVYLIADASRGPGKPRQAPS